MNFELSESDVLRIRRCLSRQTWIHLENADAFKKKGYYGIMASEEMEAFAIQKLLGKFQIRDNSTSVRESEKE